MIAIICHVATWLESFSGNVAAGGGEEANGNKGGGMNGSGGGIGFYKGVGPQVLLFGLLTC